MCDLLELRARWLVTNDEGSMQEVHADALASVNSFFANTKKDAALRDGTFTVVAFSSLGITALREAQPKRGRVHPTRRISPQRYDAAL